MKAVHPAVQIGERDWRDYYRVRGLNLPHQYHNGGIWPFIGGFYVVALVKAAQLQEAQRALERLADLARQGRQAEWEFNEWFHGESGRPMGFSFQTWSAAMYVYAYECVRAQRAIELEEISLDHA